MVDFRQRQPVRDDWLPQLLIGIHDDVSGIEQSRLGQMGDRTEGAQDGIAKRCLVQPRFDLTKGIAALWRGWERCLGRSSYDRPECKLDPQALRVPADDECWDDGLISTR
jgi:hypothetical protein